MNAADLGDYREEVILRDGGSLVIRAIGPADKPLLADLMRRMSFDSIRFRFFGVKHEFTPRELAALTELDFDTHVGLAAVLRPAGATADQVVGVAELIRPAAAPRAELAVAVADEHHGRGVGTLLIEHLARVARRLDIDEIEADVLGDNARMLQVFAEIGLEVRTAVDGTVRHVVFPTRTTEHFLSTNLRRERLAAAESVRVFFEPRAVAVVGASRRELSVGHTIVSNLVRGGFQGRIYPVNPHAEVIAGLPAYPSLAAIAAAVDLVVVAVPAPGVEEVVRDAARAGAKGVVVVSAGFAETGAGGLAAEQRLREIVRAAGMRMVGPNCLGVLNAAAAVRLDATFAPSFPPPGNVSVLSQSGALGFALLEHVEHRGIGVAKFVSVGNKADVSGNDLLSFWEGDPETRVIALYLESFGNPRKFARLAPEVAREKPIVAMKSGRSAAAARAAGHRAAPLAALDVAVDALFAQAGVLRTSTFEEMLDVVALLATQPVPEGPRVGIVSNAGGPGLLLADACAAHGLIVPALAAHTVDALRALLPAQASLGNPLDVLPSATAEQYRGAVAAVGADPSIDALVAIYVPPLVARPDEIAAAIAEGAAAVPAHKPVATVFMSTAGTPEVLSRGPRGRIPSYSFPENAALALAAAEGYGRWRRRPVGRVHTFDPGRQRAVRELLAHLRETRTADGWVAPAAIAELLGLAGIAVAPAGDTGDGVDALVGVTTDPSLGPLLFAGLGAIPVELMRDVGFRLTPVSDVDAADLLDGLRAHALLDGWRGAPPADRPALLELLLRVSALVEIAPELAELDLPVRVLPAGRGAVVGDARLRLAEPSS